MLNRLYIGFDSLSPAHLLSDALAGRKVRRKARFVHEMGPEAGDACLHLLPLLLRPHFDTDRKAAHSQQGATLKSGLCERQLDLHSGTSKM